MINLNIWKELSQNGRYDAIKETLSDPHPDLLKNDPNDFGIGLAASYGHYELVELFLNDRRVNPANNYNYALLGADAHNHNDIAELLLKDSRVMDKVIELELEKYYPDTVTDIFVF